MVGEHVTRVSISFSNEILKKLDEMAKKDSRNRSKQIEYIIKYYLENEKRD